MRKLDIATKDVPTCYIVGSTLLVSSISITNTMTDPQRTDSNELQAESDAGPQPPKQGMSGCAQAAIGFGIFCLILVGIGIAGVYYVAQNLRGIAANMVTPAIQDLVSDMEIPAEQKTQISAKINELGEDFKNEKIGVKELQEVLAGVASSPFAGAAASIWFTDEYVSKSGLTDAEKQDATMTAKRFAKGMLDKSISDKEATEIMAMISEKTPDGQTNFKQTLTDKELKETLLNMKNAADNAGVPMDVPDINFANEFDKVVDRVLKGDSNAGSPTSPASAGEPDATKEDEAKDADEVGKAADEAPQVSQ